MGGGLAAAAVAVVGIAAILALRVLLAPGEPPRESPRAGDGPARAIASEAAAPEVDGGVASASTPAREDLDRELAPGSDDEAFEGAGARPARTARPGTERWHRARFEALASHDLREFERTARERFGPAISLAECVALLDVASEPAPSLADELFAAALEPASAASPRGEALRDAVLEIGLRDAATLASARERLLVKVVLAAGQPAALRARAAFVVFRHARAAGSELANAVARVDRESDPAVRADVLRGLRRNPDEAASELFRRLATASRWHDDARAIEAEERRVEGSEPGDGPR